MLALPYFNRRARIFPNPYEKYAEDWQSIRAIVFDSCGKRYYSKPNVSEIPSWAKGIGTVSAD